MTTSARIWLSALMLGAALAVQSGLLVHMVLGPSNSYPVLRKSFSELPTKLSNNTQDPDSVDWNFVTHPAEKDIRPKLPFVPVDLIYRYCRPDDRDIDAVCYVVHSEYGEDRRHHPEICIRDVQKMPEDETSRGIVWLGDDRPVQRLSFKRGPTQAVTVYYWHYTFAPEPQEGQTWLQRLYQTFSRNPPSVTVQVTTSASHEQWPIVEKGLLVSLDRKLRSDSLPAGARMGCDRLPIAIAVK